MEYLILLVAVLVIGFGFIFARSRRPSDHHTVRSFNRARRALDPERKKSR